MDIKKCKLPCLRSSFKKKVLFVCYVDDWFLITRKDLLIEAIENKLGRKFLINNLKRFRRLSETELKWHSDRPQLIS